MIEKIVNDGRSIKSITTQGDNAYWCVEYSGVTHITAYSEYSQIGIVTWFAVYESDWLAARVNAAHVESVRYSKAPKEK